MRLCVPLSVSVCVCVCFIYSSPLFALITTASSPDNVTLHALSYTYDKLLLSKIIIVHRCQDDIVSPHIKGIPAL